MLRDLGGISFRVREDAADLRGRPLEMPGRLRDGFSWALCVHDPQNCDPLIENTGHTRREADGGGPTAFACFSALVTR